MARGEEKEKSDNATRIVKKNYKKKKKKMNKKKSHLGREIKRKRKIYILNIFEKNQDIL